MTVHQLLTFYAESHVTFFILFFFFFQAEDGIRDLTVTGVQTCALPISFCSLVFQTKCIGRKSEKCEESFIMRTHSTPDEHSYRTRPTPPAPLVRLAV